MDDNRTELREVDGITFDMRPNGTLKHRLHKIVFRITKDERGKSISLCDELRGIMLEIPLEPVANLFSFTREPAEPTTDQLGNKYCGFCKRMLDDNPYKRFCAYCGQEVKRK